MELPGAAVEACVWKTDVALLNWLSASQSVEALCRIRIQQAQVCPV